LNKIDIED